MPCTLPCRCPAPSLVHAACAAIGPLARLAPHPASNACSSTRQSAHEFNQPLSWDTSSVTIMYDMFVVRFVWAPTTFNRALPLHAARYPCPHVSRPAPRLLAARGGVQPADPQLQYVQGHNHERYVASALLLRATSCPAALPALHRLPSFRLSTLGRPRLCSTSRSPSIRPALRT